jgi:hypothetical protein
MYGLRRDASQSNGTQGENRAGFALKSYRGGAASGCRGPAINLGQIGLMRARIPKKCPFAGLFEAPTPFLSAVFRHFLEGLYGRTEGIGSITKPTHMQVFYVLIFPPKARHPTLF